MAVFGLIKIGLGLFQRRHCIAEGGIFRYRRIFRQRYHQVFYQFCFQSCPPLFIIILSGISTRFDRVELDFKEVNLGTPAVVYHRAWARSRDWCRQRRVMGLQEAFFGG
jgi:hypothetical protein